MSSFGTDESVFLTAADIIQSSRFQEVSSSGSHLAFTLKTLNREKGRDKEDKESMHSNAATNLYSFESGGRVKQMTHLLKGGVSNPVFALDISGADDAVLYLQDGQVRSLALDGGESASVTNFPLGIESFKIFKGQYDTVWLAFVMSVYPDKSPKETREIDSSKMAPNASSGMVFDSLMVRHWDSWNCYEKRNHVFVSLLSISPTGHLRADGDLTDLMYGMQTDCPCKPFNGFEEYEPSPKGDTMAIACRRVIENKQPDDMAWSTCVSIFTVSIPAVKNSSSTSSTLKDSSAKSTVGLEMTMISDPANLAVHSSPVFSPDGDFIAFLAMSRAQYESDRQEVILYNRNTQELNFITRSVDLSFGSIAFSPQKYEDGTIALLCTAQYLGSNRIFEVKTKSGAFMSLGVILGDETRTMPSIVTNKDSTMSLFFLESSLVSPNILKVAKLDGNLFNKLEPDRLYEMETGEAPFVKSDPSSIRSLRDVYCPCPQFMNGDITMPQATQFYFAAKDSEGNKKEDIVQMIYVAPVQLQNSEDEKAASESSYPLVLIIHGGPQGAILNSWHYRWNLCFYSSLGYGVIAVNFHGSTGFGQSFVDSIRYDWGGQPFRDCLTGVDEILSLKPYLDPSRVGALGASYGGYMINWINGHSDRFKCLVNHDGIFNLRTLYYATEELWFPEFEFGLPWESNEFDKWNPEAFVGNWKTPTLVIQGGKDYRVVETEGLSTFTALQRQGIPSQLLFFPDENHWCLKTANSLKWHETVAKWLQTWLK